MKNTLIAIIAALFLCINPSFSQEHPESGAELVVLFNDYSEELNMDVQVAFQNDPSLVVINSCDALGIIVFKSKAGSEMNKVQAKSYLTIKMKDKLQLESGSYKVEEELSPSEVLILCRKKMQAIHEVDAE